MKYKFVSFLVVLMLVAGQIAYTNTVPEKLVLHNGARAYYLLPEKVSKGKKYPLLLVLHGKGENALTSFHAWSAVAKRYGYVLLAPQGTGEQNSYIKDLEKNINNINDFTDLLRSRVALQKKGNTVGGFSMGGTFAIDLALEKPEEFTNIISLFGFFPPRQEEKLLLMKRRVISRQRYYFVTGTQDVTRPVLKKAEETLKQYGALVRIDIRPGLLHAFPENFSDYFAQIKRFFSF